MAIPTITFASLEPTGTVGTPDAVSLAPVPVPSVPPVPLSGAGDGVVGVDGVEGAVALPFSAATANVEKPGEVASK